MQSLTQWFSGLSTVDPAIWLALGAGVVVILGFWFYSRHRRRSGGPIMLPNGSPDWELPLPAARNDERRRAIRRGGLPTPIIVVDPKQGKKAKSYEAYVLDRSTGGLRLALERPFPIGSTLMGRPSNAPDGFDWVKMTIRNCKETGDYYEIGCQFDVELELSRLLLFG